MAGLTDPSGLTANPDGCWDWWGYAGDDARSLIGPSSFRPGSADAASARHGESISAPLRSEYPLAAVSTCNNRHAWPLAHQRRSAMATSTSNARIKAGGGSPNPRGLWIGEGRKPLGYSAVELWKEH